MRRPILKSLAMTAAVGAILSLGMVPASMASADTNITVSYPVSGSTFIHTLKATVPLGPGTLSTTVDLTTSTIVASTLTLPPATASVKEFGVIPVSATTEFVPTGTPTGTVNLSQNTVTETSQAFLKITKLSVAGLNIPVGSSCQTQTPISITVNSQPGFNLLNGGNLAGTYTIPRFDDCGLATFLINLSIPGSGNTITLTLGAATL
jgi:hypothetical protein